MFGSFAPTPYDLRFELLGIPVRVHPIFWLSSGWLAWHRGRLDIVAVQVLCIFLAVLVHEMGHALVTRRFGWQPEIVL
ncbi:MAG: Zn-dependent protease, partial [Planctomycetaceae bacterium]|nr:Zn-dependent protease [Planctomycetaceae bacterium]